VLLCRCSPLAFAAPADCITPQSVSLSKTAMGGHSDMGDEMGYLCTSPTHTHTDTLVL